ncbi:hypothetical protein VOA_000853 [Vibrio sp. RC586]|nr:hypothetical protein VOA_000853 [Vibrio sp. RC586]
MKTAALAAVFLSSVFRDGLIYHQVVDDGVIELKKSPAIMAGRYQL